ncbi:MAG TPA: 50S ribosomal protein L25 [Ignavibacteriaceae bacterium]|nr:50S ribosomal protein L25 [Ignavibacteriaceae bacterium]
MEKVVLKANQRSSINKTSRSEIRKNGRVPGIFYSKHEKPIAIDVTEKSIKPLVFTSETHLISLELEGKENHECVIKDIQFDPVTDRVIHFDLLGLTVGEKFQLEVPIQYHGSPVGVKEGGVLQQFLHKLEIECLPKDIPQRLDINIQDLKLGDAIHIKDLKFENITLLNLEDSVVVAVTHPKVEKVATAEELAAEAQTQPEVIGKEKAEEEEK